MVKIIKDGGLRQTICSHCISLLEYDHIKDPFCDDIRYDDKRKVSIYSWYIKCPKCGSRIKVEERPSK